MLTSYLCVLGWPFSVERKIFAHIIAYYELNLLPHKLMFYSGYFITYSRSDFRWYNCGAALDTNALKNLGLIVGWKADSAARNWTAALLVRAANPCHVVVDSFPSRTINSRSVFYFHKWGLQRGNDGAVKKKAVTLAVPFSFLFLFVTSSLSLAT